MEVDRHADRALYLQLADVLRDDIAEGRLSPGARLPSEAELIETHGVSRGTAREAIGVLRNEGSVVVEHGRGAFVRSVEQAPIPRLVTPTGPHLGLREAFRHSVRRAGQTPSIRDVASDNRPQTPSNPGLNVSGALETETVLCFADGRPLALSVLWWPKAGVDASDPDLEEGVTARMPRRDERRLLQLNDGAPVLVLSRTLLFHGKLIEHSDSVIAADRQHLVYKLTS
ncbi:GntR family transcriptional regulator [Euzebya rosea]|uniref:GntR family transcriptional regulator n=1 Tax=Euzebya rosea TaxID=2052804 RepID=UPI000D3E3625|nr:GntR family transcriptional regulator [Euzebya rosea]